MTAYEQPRRTWALGSASAAMAALALVLAGCSDTTKSNQARNTEESINEYSGIAQSAEGSAGEFVLADSQCPEPEVEEGFTFECTASYVIDGEGLGRGPVEVELQDCDDGDVDESASCQSSVQPTGRITSTQNGFELKGAGGGKEKSS